MAINDIVLQMEAIKVIRFARFCDHRGYFTELTEPLGYLDFLKLMSEAKVVITDSGGIQEETTILGVPCLAVRENTERPITVTEGINILVGTDTGRILNGYRESLNTTRPHSRPKLWDGKAAERIARVLVNSL